MDIQSNDKELFVVLFSNPAQLIEMTENQVLSTLKQTDVYEDRDEAIEAIKIVNPDFEVEAQNEPA